MYTFVFGNLANIGTDGIPFLLFIRGYHALVVFAGASRRVQRVYQQRDLFEGVLPAPLPCLLATSLATLPRTRPVRSHTCFFRLLPGHYDAVFPSSALAAFSAPLCLERHAGASGI
jgi:hypothetical protein